MKKRNIFIIIPCLLLVLAFNTGTVHALFNDVTPLLENRFTMAHEGTELVEPVFEMRGSVLHKEPMVMNTGTAPCLVRLKVMVDPEEIFASDVLDEPDESQKELLLDSGYRFWLDFQDSWEYNETDGYWYYTDVLGENEDTEPIFKTVNWLNVDEDGNWIDYQSFDIYIHKESTYYEIEDGGNVISAMDAEGVYDASNAQIIWEHYDNN